MQVTKLGESLAVVLPNSVAESHGLKEGDEVEIEIRSADWVTSAEEGRVVREEALELATERRQSREAALKVFDELSRPFPDGFKFDREEANAR